MTTDEIMGGALAEAVRAAVAAERARREAAEAECDRLRGELTAVRRAVRMLDGARAAIDANGQRVLRSLAGEERAALLEELAAARRERDDWNARATAMEAERDEARAAVAAERTRREAAEASATRSADAAVDAVRELGHIAAAAVTRADAAEAEVVRLRECLARANVSLEATERARYAAEEERDAALELVAPDAVEAARLRDARDAERLHALVVTRVDLADARASHAALAAAVRAERAVRAESDAAWADYITADAGAAEVLAIDARLDAARAALDAALEAL